MTKSKEKILLKSICIQCNKPQHCIVYEEDYEKFKSGEGLTQECFPYLSADQREILISGICGRCFDEMFDDED